MDYAIDSWDPDYGASIGAAMEDSDAQVDLDREMVADTWAPIATDEPRAPTVVFVDGVRRIDARVWAIGPERTEPALAVSIAAGAVRCTDRAEIIDTRVERILVGRAGLVPISGSGIDYQPVAAAADDEATLVAAIQQQMGSLEARVAADLDPCDLLAVDGPLTGRSHIRDAVGYVKSHRTTYLPATVEPVVRRLAPGERTPLFLLSTSWQRWSWYLRLPGGTGHPWAGVVRLEAPPSLNLERAVALANRTAATLPRFASPPHRDARAPANLLPIAGLEDRLHHLLGDRDLLQRRLRRLVRTGIGLGLSNPGLQVAPTAVGRFDDDRDARRGRA